MIAEMVLAGVPIEWLRDPETRAPQVWRMAARIQRGQVRQTQRACRAIIAAFNVDEQKRLNEDAKPKTKQKPRSRPVDPDGPKSAEESMAAWLKGSSPPPEPTHSPPA